MSNNNNHAGKGDKPRPVNKKQYNDNYDSIDWGRPKKAKVEYSQEYLKKHQEMEAQSWMNLKKTK